ncbi:GNAT family N-acetyltransferase, partial [candidate division CSSED10-310 bacterium]
FCNIGILFRLPSNTGNLMMDAILELSFEKLDFNTLNSEVLSDNKLAYIYNRRFGFKEEGRLRSYFVRDDGLLDVILFGMLKEEFYQIRQENNE